MASERPNIATARAVAQIDGPNGLTVTGWQPNDGGEAVVVVARTVPGKKPASIDFPQSDVDAAGWALFEVVRTRALEEDFDLSPAEVSPLLAAISAARNALRRDAERRVVTEV